MLGYYYCQQETKVEKEQVTRPEMGGGEYLVQDDPRQRLPLLPSSSSPIHIQFPQDPAQALPSAQSRSGSRVALWELNIHLEHN